MSSLQDVDAEGAIFHNATLREWDSMTYSAICWLYLCVMCSEWFYLALERCEFTGANLRGALLAGANLQSANLQGNIFHILKVIK